MISRRSLLTLAATAAGSTALPAGLLLSSPRSEAQALARPSRIVVAGGAVTETLYALGLGDRIVAVDTTSTYPPDAMALPKVGYLRQLSAEGVLALKPDLILFARDAGPPAAIEQIKASGIPLAVIETGWSTDGVAAMIETAGGAAGEAGAATRLASRVRGDFATLAGALPAERGKTVLLLLSVGVGPMLGAGTDTAADAIIRLAGGRTAFPDMKGYKPLSLEPVLAADPDWIVLPSHVATSLGGPGRIAALDIVARTRAGAEGRVAIIDSLYLLGFGPRAPQAAADLATLLYPAAGIPAIGRAATPSPLVTVAGA